jgi:hypothetical protein
VQQPATSCAYSVNKMIVVWRLAAFSTHSVPLNEAATKPWAQRPGMLERSGQRPLVILDVFLMLLSATLPYDEQDFPASDKHFNIPSAAASSIMYDLQRSSEP